MLKGKWPSGGCEYCKDIEQGGGTSDRLLHLSIPGKMPDELEANNMATTVTPTIVEVYFDNACNMACLYCWDGFSSKIQQENNLFGRFEQQGVVIENSARKVENFDELTQTFWSWMTKNYSALERFQVLGGEPFYQQQFTKCLDFLDTHENSALEFNVISNLMISNKRLREIIAKIKQLVDDKKIKRFDLTASIDCFGSEQEYVRFGLNLQQWKENFEFLVSENWIFLNINQTLSNLTVKTVPELLQFINKFTPNREIGHYFSLTVMTHDFLHPCIFGSGFWTADFQKILDNMKTDTWQQKQAKLYMTGIMQEIDDVNHVRDQNKIDQLGLFLEEIDRRRKLNWKTTFPWLTKEINRVV
jgi:organic radical activating enzyme